MKYYPLTILTLLAIAVLSLFPVKELHLENMTLSDKWAHTLMYAGLTAVMVFERSWNKKKIARSPWLLILPVLYGGLMELLQAYCTNGNRSGDWLDVIANAIGAVLVYCVVLLLTLSHTIIKNTNLKDEKLN